MNKNILITRVDKSIPCKDYIGKPAVNAVGEVIGTIINAVELRNDIKLTIEVDKPLSLIAPYQQSFEIRGVQ